MDWCDKCGRKLEHGRDYHSDRSGKWCDGKRAKFVFDLKPQNGWQTYPPAPPASNGHGVERELWWFFGSVDGGKFELRVVENALLGSGSSAWQMFMCDHDFQKPTEMVGYWRRLDRPRMPKPPAMPWS